MKHTVIDARYTLPRHPDPTNRWLKRSAPVDRFVIHHSATHAAVTAKTMADYHISRGRPGIAYHYVIGPDGIILWCNSDDLFTWHGNDFNTGIGICLTGDFTSGEPTDCQLASARWLYATKQKEHGPLPLVGHKEAPGAATQCPGNTWVSWRSRIETPQQEEPMVTKTGFHIQRTEAWIPLMAREWGGLTWQKFVNPSEIDFMPHVQNKLVRRWHDNIQQTYIDRGHQGGIDWLRWMLPWMQARPWATAFETTNEPNTWSNADLANLRRFSLGAMEEANRHGIKLCILNLPEGNPASGDSDPAKARAAERWKLEQLWSAVDYAAEHGHYVGLHAYWLPDRGIGPLDRWHGLGRVEWNVQQWLDMGVNPQLLRVVVNETGVDGLIEQQRSGWRSRSNLVQYTQHIAELEARAQKLPWLVGLQLFTVGFEPPWGDYDHTESDLRHILSALPHPAPTPPPPPPPPPDEEPVPAPATLQNGAFTKGFVRWEGIGELWVASFWTPFWSEHDPSRPSYDRRPEYKRSGDEASGPRRAPAGFNSAQQWFSWSGHHRAGIYQRVSATPSRKYKFSVQAMAWYSTADDPFKSERNADDPGYQVRVGIDLLGGTDWQSPSVVWSAPTYPHDVWDTISTTVTTPPTSPAITVFVYGEPTWPVRNVNCYVGDANLTLIADPQPISDAEFAQRMQEFVVPLNPDTAIAKSAAALDPMLTPASDEQQIEGEIGQVWRTGHEPDKQKIARVKIGDWANVRWIEHDN